uniref:(northern house mosquito) hypothetical protein n=1 Tax=Culex pipiens TaxID=7175 RepID=A0A8D8F7R1_CULPI
MTRGRIFQRTTPAADTTPSSLDWLRSGSRTNTSTKRSGFCSRAREAHGLWRFTRESSTKPSRGSPSVLVASSKVWSTAVGSRVFASGSQTSTFSGLRCQRGSIRMSAA